MLTTKCLGGKTKTRTNPTNIIIKIMEQENPKDKKTSLFFFFKLGSWIVAWRLSLDIVLEFTDVNLANYPPNVKFEINA